MDKNIEKEQNKELHELYWTEPYITAYPRYANVLAIISQFERGELWLLSHCIQLQINEGGYGAMNLDFCVGDIMNTVHRCPMLDVGEVDREDFAEGMEDTIDRIIYYLDQGKYVYLPVDWFYISAYMFYGKSHNAHDMLIFGYDRVSREFMVADFFGNFKYGRAKCSFEEFYEAFCGTEGLACVLEKVMLVRPCCKEVPLDIEMVKGLVEDYIGGVNSNRKFLPVSRYLDFLDDDKFSFGTNIYRKLTGNLRHALSADQEVKIRSYDILYEHKKVLHRLCSYMADMGHLRDGEILLDGLANVREQCLKARNLLIKYNISREGTLLVKSAKILGEAQKKEVALLGGLLERISEIPCVPMGTGSSMEKSEAFFVGEDRRTKGDWIGKYGDAGYDIFDERDLDEKISMVCYKLNYKRWNKDDAGNAELLVKKKSGRETLAVCRYFLKEAYIDLLIRDRKKYMLSFYILAWWKYKRNFEIRLLDSDRGKLLCMHEVAACNEGLYVNFVVRGHIRVEFINHAQDAGVVSGIFYSAIE